VEAEVDEEVGVAKSILGILKGAVKGFVLAFVVVFPFACAYGFWQASGRQKYVNITSTRAKVLAQAWIMYSDDYDQRTCPSANWNLSLARFYKDPKILEDASVEKGELRGIGLNTGFEMTQISALPEMRKTLVFALTTKVGKDALVGKDSLRSYSDAIDVIVSATADGLPHKTRFSRVLAMYWKNP
jgi:hypothetical protein